MSRDKQSFDRVLVKKVFDNLLEQRKKLTYLLLELFDLKS
jgi:hypothetical protein